MNSETSIVLLGGDRRMAYAAQALRAFFPVHTLYLEEAYPCLEEKRTDPDQILPLCSICLLPVPAQRESFWVRTPEKEIDLRPLLRKLPVGARVLGGSFSAPLQAFFRQEGLSFFDYGKEEAFIEENARLTAEGVLPLLIERSPKALTDCSVLITGYGHTARALAELLQKVGCRVTIAARRQEVLKQAEQDGFFTWPVQELTAAPPQDGYINTPPAMLFDRTVLEMLPKDSLLIDIASYPGGVDLGEAKRLGLSPIWALQIPGKVSPYSAGQAIAKTILRILK